MNKLTGALKQKIENIEFGLLRFREKNEQYVLEVKVSGQGEEFLKCVITGLHPGIKMLNRQVNLIQKYGDEYLFIAGFVSEEKQTSKSMLTVRIKKACWFIRRSKGSVSWLQQKYVYEPESLMEEKLAV